MAWNEFIWRCTQEEAAHRAGFPDGNLILRDGPEPSEFFKPKAVGPPAHCGFSAAGPEVRDVAAALLARIERRLVQPLRRYFVAADYQISPIVRFADAAQHRVDDALEYWALRVVVRAKDGTSAGGVDPARPLGVVASARKAFVRRTQDVFRGAANAPDHEFAQATRTALTGASTYAQAASALLPEIQELILRGDES
jgi:hypothetical protein